MKKVSYLILLLSVLFIGCDIGTQKQEELQTNNTGTITGHVIYDGLEDSSGITVAIDRTNGLMSLKTLNDECFFCDRSVERSIVSYGFTIKDGSYKFENLEEGTYTIYARSNNSLEEAVTTNVVVTEGETVTAEDLKLTPVGSLEGKITLDNSESDNSGFLVSIAGTSYIATTNKEGSFVISGIPAGNNYEIVIIYGTFTYFWKSEIVVKGLDTTSVGSINFKKSELIPYSETTSKNNEEKVGTIIIWLGSFDSAPENPEKLNAYYNTSDGCSYIYDGENWTLLASKGNNGSDGTGIDGKSIVWLGSFDSAPENPEKLNAYYNTSDGCSYIYDGENWTLLASKGNNGSDGTGIDGKSIVWLGSFDSAPVNPEKLNAYYNTSDGCSYIYDGENWTLLASKGDSGSNADGNGGDSSTSLIRYGFYNGDIYEFIHDEELNIKSVIDLNSRDYPLEFYSYSPVDVVPHEDLWGTNYDVLLNRNTGILKEYDTNGNMIKAIKHNGVIKYQEIYYSNKKEIKTISYDTKGSVSELKEYDSNGKMIKDTYYNSDGSVSYQNEYDSNGNLTTYSIYNCGYKIYSCEYYSNGCLKNIKDKTTLSTLWEFYF